MKKNLLISEQMHRAACCEPDRLDAELGIPTWGLTEAESEEMRRRCGENQLTGKRSDSLWARFRRAFINPFNLVLLFLAAVSAAAGYLDHASSYSGVSTGIILAMVALSGGIRLIQELRAKSAQDQLDKLLHAEVTVLRDGAPRAIPARELVVGDRVFLYAGDRVPADLRLLSADDLFLSHAAITGESGILEKDAAALTLSGRPSLSDYRNLAFMGATVISGRGEGVVLAVGRHTLYATFTGYASEQRSGFERGAHSISMVLLRFIAVLVPLIFVACGLTKQDWGAAFLFALSVAVGLTPEMLPMVITTCLAKGSRSMARHKALVKNIDAMQSFGSMDVLCADKTGTLTQESLLLEYYMDVLGNEDASVWDAAYLNSLFYSGVKNPIDEAILHGRSTPQQDAHFAALAAAAQKLDEIPFDYSRRCASVLIRRTDGSSRILTKGNPEEVLARCTQAAVGGQVHPIAPQDRRHAFYLVSEMLEDGMKVIAVACRDLPDGQASLSTADEAGLTLMGYLAFFDAPKRTAAQAVQKLAGLHVQTKILTGDCAAVARSVCRRVGVPAGQVVTGSQLRELPHEELPRIAEENAVFAELTPDQKVQLILALRENGHTVGFLGDGMNDIPAISEADVGISVDTAVEAAREVADVVLLEKDLNVLESAILEGRRTFANMTKYIRVTASSNFGNILSIALAGLFLPFLPMTALQILLLNLLYDLVCIALPWDNVDPESCAYPREWTGRHLSRFMCWFGPISSLFDFATFAFLYFVLCPALCGGQLFHSITDPALQAQYAALFHAGWFLESMWTQVLVLNTLRTRRTPFVHSRPAAPVLGVTAAGIVLFTALLYTPLGAALGLAPLPPVYFLFLAAVVLCYLLLAHGIKQLYLRRNGELF